jgi:hypothetical protein
LIFVLVVVVGGGGNDDEKKFREIEAGNQYLRGCC